MADFSIGGVPYQSKMMDGETQAFVLKRLLPTFTALVGVAGLHKAGTDPAAEAKGDGPDDEAARSEDRAKAMLMPVARELALLSDADVRFILDACMDVTQRRIGAGVGWAGVRQRGIVQDQTDAKFITRLTIAWHVLGENFGEMLSSFGLDLAKIAEAAPKPA